MSHQHPSHLLHDITRRSASSSPLLLKVVAYPREGKFAPVEVPDWDWPAKSTSKYMELNWARKDLLLMVDSNIDHMVQTAALELACEAKAHGHKLDVFEWGISTVLGEYFWPAADMIGFESFRDEKELYRACRKMRLLLGDFGVEWSEPEVYYTGNSYHIYADTLLPLKLRTEWLHRLAEMDFVDPKWIQIARQFGPEEDQAVLRWSAGGNNRCVPFLKEFT